MQNRNRKLNKIEEWAHIEPILFIYAINLLKNGVKNKIILKYNQTYSIIRVKIRQCCEKFVSNKLYTKKFKEEEV